MKKYSKPEMEITLFHTEDIITASGMNQEDTVLDYNKVPEIDISKGEWE